MEKERRKGTWRQVALLLLVAAFLVSGTGIFKKKIEENRQQDIQRQEVEKAFEQMMAAQADGGADAGKGQTKGQNGSADGQTTEGNGTTQPASGADQSQGQQAPELFLRGDDRQQVRLPRQAADGERKAAESLAMVLMGQGRLPESLPPQLDDVACFFHMYVPLIGSPGDSPG